MKKIIGYVIIRDDGQYVGIDSASGGYPYLTNTPVFYNEFERVKTIVTNVIKVEKWHVESKPVFIEN